LKKLGKYEVVAELGHGAMGVVYRARDPFINRLVALKTITTGVADDPALLQRFYREAQSAGRLQHPNIITIYDMGEEGKTPFIAMELVEGENLEQLIARRAAISISLKLVYAMQACRAFDYAHKQGIVHRDIKPGNIMISKEGTVKVVDFGIARVLEASKTQTGMLIGTLAYMSPEQYHGEHADERSDVWSFGVLFYELLCYRRPFQGDTPASLMKSICEQEPEPLTKLLPECPADLESVVSKMLKKSPGDRYQSMEDLMLELDPVSKRLQEQTVAELVDQSRKYVEQSQFAEARDLLRQALRFEYANQQVRSLLEKVNSEMKRILVRPKVQQFVEKAQTLLKEGKLRDARIAVESALELDSSFEEAQELRRVVRQELDRAELIAGWLKSAKRSIAEGLPDEAEALVAKVLEAEPTNAQAAALQQQVVQEKIDRQKRLRLLERLQFARGLWTRQKYSECIQLLVDLQKEFPEDEEVPTLLETVREDQAERREQALLDCRNLLAAGRYEACLAHLNTLQEQFPRDQEIPALLEEVHKEQRNRRRLQGLAEAKSVLAARRYDDAISLLSALSEEFPQEQEIAAVLQTAREGREEHRRQEGIVKARELLAARRYEEAFAFLGELRADFPGEPQIANLLETARRDQAEQYKQEKLGEARALLAIQSFEEALGLLDALAKEHAKDTAVVKLRALVQREQEKHARTERIQRESDSLRKLLSEKRYSEVIAQAKQLLTEFPGETSFRRLAEFAVSQQESDEKESLLRHTLEEAKNLIDARRFKQAIDAAQIGLKTFPANPDLLYLYQQAEIQQKKLEVREQIEERVREIRVKINREKFSEAINLAKQTLVTLGPDTNVSQLLNTAEIEFETREKKREQARTLETIRTLIESGKLGQASQAIDAALNAKTLEPADPRVQRLSAHLKDAQPEMEEPEVIPTPIPSSFEAELADVVEPAVPLAQPPPPPEKTFVRHATTAQGAAVQPALEAQSAAPVASPETTSATSSPPAASTRRPQTFTGEPSEEEVVSGGEPAKPIETPALFSTSAAPAKTPAAGTLTPETTWSRHRAAVLSIAALGLIVVGWAGVYVFHAKLAEPSAKVSPQPLKPAIDPNEVRQRQVLNAVGPLIAANDFDVALKQLQEAVAWNGPLTLEIQKRISLIDESKKDPSLRQALRREEVLWQQAQKSVAEGKYIEAREKIGKLLALHAGTHREEAQTYLENVINRKMQDDDLIAQAHMEMSQGEFQTARFLCQQLKQNGGDAAPLLSKIDEAERTRLKDLEDQLNQLKQRDDDAAVQKLKVLQLKFQALSSDGGPQSNEAASYANGIPAAIVNVQNRVQAKNASSPPVPAESPAVATAKNAVRLVILRYVQAFEQRNADNLTKIWPTIGSNYTGYKSAFDAASSIRMRFSIRTLDVSTDGASAIVEARVTEDYTPKDGRDPRTTKQALTFQLDKLEGSWIITDIQETQSPEN
jgi:eukaryotic-like serine/threonine-protein kinase